MGDPLGGWGASPHLALPKVMPADVSGAVDMEKVKPGPNPTPYRIAMIEGVVRMLFPTAFARIEAGIGQNAGAIIAAAVVLALLGADAHSFLAARRHRFPANLPFPSSHDALN